MEKNKKWVLIIVVILLLIIPLLKEMVDNSKPEGILYQEFKNNLISNNEVIVYIASTKGTTYKDTLENLKSLEGIYEYQVMEYENLSTEDKIEIVKLGENILELPAFVFIKDNEIKGIRNGSFSPSDLNTLAAHYLDGKTENINYKVAKDSKSFLETLNEDKITVVTFGSAGCGYCEAFKPILNDVATKYDVDIYYFDTDYFNNDEFVSILDGGYKIPAKSESTEKVCSKKGEVSPLTGFGTPLTLLIKNGKTIDCHAGLTDEKTLDKIFTYNKIKKTNEEKKEVKKVDKKTKKSTKKK